MSNDCDHEQGPVHEIVRLQTMATHLACTIVHFVVTSFAILEQQRNKRNPLPVVYHEENQNHYIFKQEKKGAIDESICACSRLYWLLLHVIVLLSSFCCTRYYPPN